MSFVRGDEEKTRSILPQHSTLQSKGMNPQCIQPGLRLSNSESFVWFTVTCFIENRTIKKVVALAAV